MSDDPIKDALKIMPYGFYSITSKNGDEVNAMVANWVIQASFTPRHVALALAKKSHTYQIIPHGRVFAVNIFNKADQDALIAFSKSTEKNPDKMKNAQYTPAPETGCPVLEGASAYVECRVINVVDSGGDHVIIVGEVVGAGMMKDISIDDVLTLPHIGWSYAG